MASPLNDDSKVLFKLLEDRQWHNYEELISQLAEKVPPGRAMRKYNQSIELSARRKVMPGWDPGHDDATRIELGQKRVAYAAASNWIRQQALEVRGYRQQKEVRVIPGYTPKQIPGYEPSPESQDPALQAQGSPEVPPADSEPSEQLPRTGDGQEPSEPVSRLRQEGQEWVRVEDGPAFAGHGPSPYDWPPLTPAVARPCPDCGLQVGDAAKHEDWHRRQVKPDTDSEMALLNTSQLQEAVRVVMSQELDEFQRGMQGYLSQQFAQLTLNVNLLRPKTNVWTGVDSAGIRSEQA